MRKNDGEYIVLVGVRVGCEMDKLAGMWKIGDLLPVLTTPTLPKMRVFGHFDKKPIPSIVNGVSGTHHWHTTKYDLAP